MIRFWWLPNPPAFLPFAIRRAWLALAIWRGWPAPRFASLEEFDAFADITARLAWDIAGDAEGGGV